jgi:DedD protein
VLEGKHVIGLFLLMLLFSGVFFSLGYVMGRNQYDGQVRAATTNSRTVEPSYVPKSGPAARQSADATSADSESDPATTTTKGPWDYSHTATPAKLEPRLEPLPKASATPAPVPKSVSAKVSAQPAAPVARNGKQLVSAPLIPNDSVVLQVAALTKQDDALIIASSLQKKHFAAYVTPPQKDKLYRVQVGPFKDQKSADAVKKGLESAGFRAFFVKH